jgi:hypothetical protein
MYDVVIREKKQRFEAIQLIREWLIPLLYSTCRVPTGPIPNSVISIGILCHSVTNPIPA